MGPIWPTAKFLSEGPEYLQNITTINSGEIIVRRITLNELGLRDVRRCCHESDNFLLVA
jgi:hypothetical protein